MECNDLQMGIEYEEVNFYCMEIQMEGLRPNARTIVWMLLASEKLMDLRLGKKLNEYCLRNGFLESSAHVVTTLISLYLKCDLIMA